VESRPQRDGIGSDLARTLRTGKSRAEIRASPRCFRIVASVAFRAGPSANSS